MFIVICFIFRGFSAFHALFLFLSFLLPFFLITKMYTTSRNVMRNTGNYNKIQVVNLHSFILKANRVLR